MKPDKTEERLNDYLDGLLSPEDAATFEKELADDPALQAEADALRTVMGKAQALPRELAPPRDLWPAISTKLERGQSHGSGRTPWWSHSIVWAAASLLLVAGAALTMLVQSGVAPTLRPNELLGVFFGSPASGVMSLEYREAEAEFIKARSELRMAVDRQKERLSPETLAVVEENLAIIDNAIAEMQTALQDNPQNMRLTEQLLAMYQKQVDLLQQASQLADAS